MSESQLSDLLEGKRPEEIAVIDAKLESARVQAREAGRVLNRQADLLKRGATTQASFGAASTALDTARAKVAELEAVLAVAKLPARADAIKAARAGVAQANASLEAANWRLEQRMLSSPKPGIVTDVVRNIGEVAVPRQRLWANLM